MEENNFKSAPETSGSFYEADFAEKAKSAVWENSSRYFFLLMVFFIPVFVFPFVSIPIEQSKAYFVFLGTAVIAVLWLVGFIQKGKIVIPKSALLGSFFILSFFYLLSSFFSDNSRISLIGGGYGLDSFVSITLFSFLVVFAVLLFQEKKDAFSFFYLLLASSAALFAFQFFKILFNFSFPSFYGAANSSRFLNLFGSWNELGIFFGLAALLSVIALQFLNRRKPFFVPVLTLSLIAAAAVNFKAVFVSLAVFSLVFILYVFSISKKANSFASVPFVLFIVSVLFIFLTPVLGGVLQSNGLNYIEVRPSWAATFGIVKQSLRQNPLLGSGPGTFVYNWMAFKNQAVNLTQFWSARFNYGTGFIPSSFATGGAVAIIGWLAVFVVFILQFFKIISSKKENEEDKDGRFLILASFFGAAYLWLFNIIYAPSFALTAFAFIFTGLFIAQLARDKKIKTAEISFLNDPKTKFIAALSTLVVIIASLGVFYVFTKKYLASYYFAKGLETFNKSGSVEEAERYFISSVGFDKKEDKVFRALTEIGLIKLNRILNNSELPQDELRARFQNGLQETIQFAGQATEANGLDPLNWANSAKVYEAVVPLKIEGTAPLALSGYSEAAKRDPLNPDYLIAMARVYVQENNLQEAKNELQKAVALKPDYAVPNFILAQLEAMSGNMTEAIKRARDAYFLAPNDTGVLFQLGLLYYQNKEYDNSKIVFEKTVSMSPNYSNARYFLGLIYDKEGRKEDAVKEFEKIEALNPENGEVKKILVNLGEGKNALFGIAPPEELPENRENPPIDPKEQGN